MDQLTVREKQLLVELVKGLSNREIGKNMGLTEGTVKLMCHTIYNKIGVRGKVGIAMWFMDYSSVA